MQSIATMEVETVEDIIECDEQMPLLHPTKVMAQYAAMEVYLTENGNGDCRGFGLQPKGNNHFALMYLGDIGWEKTHTGITLMDGGWMVTYTG